METSCAGNAMLVGHMNLKNPMKGFIVSLRWVMIVCRSYCLLDRSIQPGNVRSAEGIVLDVEYQVWLACLGVSQAVQNQQTKTGVKDAYTQYWIDYLIDQAQTLHKENPRRTATDIQTELLTWVEEHKNDIYNPFLKLDGEYFPFDLCCRSLIYYSTGFDAAVDTPVEILHTILLGIVKYLWHGSHTSWTASQKQTYSVRLQSTDISGLSIHPI